MKTLTGLDLTFTVSAPEGRVVSEDAFIAVLENDRLSVTIRYAHAEGPDLTLTAQAACPAEVRVRILPYRLELWIDNRLCDEEWPYGDCLLTQDSRFAGDFAATLTPFEEQPAVQPSVTGTFTNALGWQPEPTVFVGDCMPYVHENRYHVLYLKDRHHHQSKWTLGAHQWAHISTADFNLWQTHPMAVEITDPKEGSICTGSWIEQNGTQYLYYTVRTTDGSPAPVCRSISRDGYHFEKDEGFSFTLSEKYVGANARDPKLIRDDNGLFHMLVTTRLVDCDRGCLAHLTSADLESWQEEENPLYIAEDSSEPECPDYIAYNNHYYLIYSLHGSAHYLYSDRPFDGWQEPAQPIIPCESVPKGGVWQDKIVFSGFVRLEGYAGTLSFRTASAAPSGELIFE